MLRSEEYIKQVRETIVNGLAEAGSLVSVRDYETARRILIAVTELVSLLR
jgi:hypothetical protein